MGRNIRIARILLTDVKIRNETQVFPFSVVLIISNNVGKTFLFKPYPKWGF